MIVLLVCGSGGHTTRALKLANMFDRNKCKFIIPYESRHTKKKIGTNYFSVISPRFTANANKIMSMIRTLFLCLHSLFILIIIKPKLVISTGSGLSLPVLLMSKFLCIRTIYIESPSRVYYPSITGRILINKVDLWLASWKEIQKKYNVLYMGQLI